MMSSQVERHNNLMSHCLDSLKSWRDIIMEHLEDDDKTTELENLKQITKAYCEIDIESKNTNEAAQEVSDYFDDDSNDHTSEIDELFNQKLNSKQSCANYEQHPFWKDVILGVSEDDVEEVEKVADKSQGNLQYEEMEDSIFYHKTFTPPVDPISKMEIKEPCKSRKCGHIYEHKFILQYIKAMKNKAKCPYIGCNNRNLTQHEIVEDPATKAKIIEYLQKRTQDQSDEDQDD